MNKVIPILEEIKANSHTPQYRMHKYYARRPYNVFSNLIAHYTNENDVILDPFCGGGVTVFESLKLKRNAVGVDLNPLATFITKMQIFTGDIKELSNEYNRFIKYIYTKYAKFFEYDFSDNIAYMEWIEWAYQVSCPICDSKITLSEQNKIRNGIYICPNTNCSNHNGVKRTECKPQRSIPHKMKYRSKDSHEFSIIKLSQLEIDHILSTEKNLESIPFTVYPNFKIPMDWDRQLEDKLQDKGIIYYKDFFTKRNFYVISAIFNDILSFRESKDYKYIDQLFFLFSSSLRYVNNMSRVTENWENGNPTSMDKHAYWLPNEYVEVNVLEVFKKRAVALKKGLKYSYENLPKNVVESNEFECKKDHNLKFSILNSSSTKLPFKDGTIDCIITDPPYGSNVQYAELSTIWNAWLQLYFDLDNYIYKKEEAVSNRKKGFEGSKSEIDYMYLLHSVFKEGYRVLKDNSVLVFTFNNKNLKVWLAMFKAVADAGFSLVKNGILFQDFIKSYKNTSHLKYSGNITGDFIYTFMKHSKENENVKISSDLKYEIERNISNTISSVFDIDTKISNGDLYKTILFNLADLISSYFSEFKSVSFHDILNYDFSNDYIDISIRKHLEYYDGHWRSKK